MTKFKQTINIFRGKFHIISAFSVGKIEKSWHLYCNLLPQRQHAAISVRREPRRVAVQQMLGHNDHISS